MMILLVVSAPILIVGVVNTMYQIYNMTVIDAKARGLKHPKFWGVFAMNGNNSSGILLYLIGRRNYPIIQMSDSEHLEIQSRKKKAAIGLVFLVIGGIGMVTGIILM